MAKRKDEGMDGQLDIETNGQMDYKMDAQNKLNGWIDAKMDIKNCK